ncbi:hypothetical protein RIF29_13527 [Crotalaria pallida]|uniref:Uncharacterized protein n=1 Tax=Crotalaria pallida TaxID=3830 RepID=A0AAN9IPJ0_CROPI
MINYLHILSTKNNQNQGAGGVHTKDQKSQVSGAGQDPGKEAVTNVDGATPHANPSADIHVIPDIVHAGGAINEGAIMGEQEHGDWLVVTRKKKAKPKSQQTFKVHDKGRINPSVLGPQNKGVSDKVGPKKDSAVEQASNVLKRGPGKRSRQEGKHDTPIHILLRNAGLNLTSAGDTNKATKPFVFQKGNFESGPPNLFKDPLCVVEANMVSFKGGVNVHDMDMVPETQFPVDPGERLEGEGHAC